MTFITETGHYSNVSNFERAIAICSNYGIDFAPCNNQIKIVNMMTKRQVAIYAETKLQNAIESHRQLVNEREAIFKCLGKKITKVLGIVDSLNENMSFKKEVKMMADKIRGFKPATLLTADENIPQLSYVNRTENFQLLIHMLSSSTCYTPNEISLKIKDLQNEQLNMQILNEKIACCFVEITNARNARDYILYDEEEGVLAIMKACKSYIKGLYGAGSEEYRSLSILKFRMKPQKRFGRS